MRPTVSSCRNSRGLKVHTPPLKKSTKSHAGRSSTRPRNGSSPVYLGNCFIDSYNFLRIGANRKAVSRSFGIETAADINRGSLLRITEFGDIHREELLSWRTQMEDRFRFDPSKGLDPADRQNLIHRFQPKMRPVERELRLGIESLLSGCGRRSCRTRRYRAMVEQSARELAQAAADLEVFTILKKP